MSKVQYQILRMETIGTPPLLKGGAVLTFDDPAQAAAYAKGLSRVAGEKLCVKPISNPAWRKRENERFADGTYRQLPWADMRWWNNCYAIWKDHFPHAAMERPGWIAYTKSEEDGAKDKQSLLRPGSYLSKYFAKDMHVHGINQQALVESFMKLYGPIDIKFAETEEDIISVYERGPPTCMNDKCWPDDTHPASIYAAGDLAVAYLGKLDGKVSARTLVWPAKKIHSRVYGDIARMTQGLQRLGYQWGPPIGAKLKRVQFSDTKYKAGRLPQCCFLAPYIDKRNQQGGGHLSVLDKGDHLVICEDGTPGSHHAGQADGHTGVYVPREDEYPTFECDHCGEQTRDALQVVYTEVNDEDHDADYSQWCRNCTARRAWHCNYSGNYYSNALADKRVMVNGMFWLQYYADMYATRCEGSGELVQLNDILVLHLPDGSHKHYSKAWVQKLGGAFRSTLTNRYWLRGERATVYSTKYGDCYACSKLELRQHSFQCDGCDTYWLLECRHQPRNDDLLLCPGCDDLRKINKLRISARRKIFEEMRQQQALPLQAAE